jgi:hypothetical protein
VLPMLYLKGISTGEFSEALAALLALAKDARGLSPTATQRQSVAVNRPQNVLLNENEEVRARWPHQSWNGSACQVPE